MRRLKRARVAIALAVGAALAVLLAGCGPSSGVVHDKRYTPAWWSYSTSCSKTCTTSSTYYPETYSLDVYASPDDHGWVSVDPATFAKLEVGDWYGERR